MPRFLSVLIGMSALFFFGAALAGPKEYLFQDKRICDAREVFCFWGTMSYRSNPRLLSLSARVQTAPGPGMLLIKLSGANELGHVRYAPFEVQIRGNITEVIDHRMIPDYPDVLAWAIDSIQFIPDKAD